MTPATLALQKTLVELGTRLGLLSRPEVSLNLAAGGYAPRIDVLWSVALTPMQYACLAGVGAVVPLVRNEVPVAAWEIEGVDASTKGMQADVANARASGAWLTGLIVHESLVSRAQSLSATQSALFGHRPTIVGALGAVRTLAAEVDTPSTFARAPQKKRSRDAGSPTESAGGGSNERTREISRTFARLGDAAGFDVVFEASTPPYAAAKTKSRIDLLWELSLPDAFVAWCERSFVSTSDEAPMFSARQRLPLVGFEFENSAAKHGHGGLLNLASHAMGGVFVAGSKATAASARAARDTYAPHYPLRYVSVNEDYAYEEESSVSPRRAASKRQ